EEKEKLEYTKWFKDIRMSDVPLVGGKNASLGEMFNALTSKGICIPDGFCVTVASYWEFIHYNKLFEQLSALMNGIDRKNYSNLKDTAEKAQALIYEASLPENIVGDIQDYYNLLCDTYGKNTDVAVRISATAEDLPSASFAGQHDSYLNIRGIASLLYAVRKCFASLFNERAIKYREDNNFEHMKVGLSVGVQKMVRSDMGSLGVGFTLEPESGFRDIVLITGSWGLGENVVQGIVNPDEFYVFKPTLKAGKNAIVNKKLGTKAKTMIYAANTDHQPGIATVNTDTPAEKREQYVLNDEEITILAQWALL